MKISRTSSISFLSRGSAAIPGIIVFMVIVYPVLLLCFKSIMMPQNAYTGAGTNLLDIIISRGNLAAFLNTLALGAAVTGLTFLFAVPAAWLVTRTNLPFKKSINRLAMLTFMIPSYILALSWMEFFGRGGYLNRMAGVFGYGGEYTFPYYSLFSVACVMSIHLYPLVFMSARNAFRNHDPSLEMAAVLSGAGPLKAAVGISLPMIAPSFISIGLLVFSRTMANFGVPALLALPVRREVLTTRIYASMSELDLATATILAVMMILFSGLIHAASLLLTGRKSYSTSTSSVHGHHIFKLGRMAYPLAVIILVIQFTTTVIPLVTIFISSFMKRWGLPLRPEYLTLDNYRILFSSAKTLSAFGNSIMYGLAAAAAAAVLSCAVAFNSRYRKGPVSAITEAAASWPMSFPNMVIAVAVIISWNRPPFDFYGKPSGMILAYSIIFIPLMLKNISGLFQSCSRSHYDASRLSGAGGFKSFVNIILPAVFPGIKSGLLVCMMIAFREIPVSLMLYGPGQETVGVLLFGMQSQSFGLEMTSTLSVVVIGLTAAGGIIVNKSKQRN